MAFGLLFASSYFSVITPQGGSQNIIFAASGYLTQRELYKLGAAHHPRLPGGVPADRFAVGVLRHELTTAGLVGQGIARARAPSSRRCVDWLTTSGPGEAAQCFRLVLEALEHDQQLHHAKQAFGAPIEMEQFHVASALSCRLQLERQHPHAGAVHICDAEEIEQDLPRRSRSSSSVIRLPIARSPSSSTMRPLSTRMVTSPASRSSMVSFDSAMKSVS